MTPEDFCRRSAEITCAHLAGCCSVSADQCVTRQRAGCDESMSNAAKRGLVFDSASADRCLDSAVGHYEGCVVPSLDESTLTGPCTKVLTGSREPGSECSVDISCLSEGVLSGVCLDNVCAQVPTQVEGAPCGDPGTAVCPANDYCDGACRRVKPLGQSCLGNNECASRTCRDSVCSAVPLAEVCASLTGSE